MSFNIDDNDIIMVTSDMIVNQIQSTQNTIEIPVNIIKEKIEFCLPPGTQIEDEAVIAINKSLLGFLDCFAKSIKYENNKIMVKNIKNTIENEKIFNFLKKLTEK